MIFRRTTVDPALGRLSDSIIVRPSLRTAACSWSGVTLAAICTTTSSWIRRVSGRPAEYPRPWPAEAGKNLPSAAGTAFEAAAALAVGAS